MSVSKVCPNCGGLMVWEEYYGFSCTECGWCEYYQDRN